MKGQFLLFFVLLLVQCKTPATAVQDSLLFEMRKTMCYGECPAYTVKIFNSGKVIYKGEKFVPLEGVKEFSLNDEDLKLIKESIEKTNLFSLKDKYYKELTDRPTTYITYYQNDQTKEIFDYYGAPQKLKEMEQLIEDTIFRYL